MCNYDYYQKKRQYLILVANIADCKHHLEKYEKTATITIRSKVIFSLCNSRYLQISLILDLGTQFDYLNSVSRILILVSVDSINDEACCCWVNSSSYSERLFRHSNLFFYFAVHKRKRVVPRTTDVVLTA